MTDKADGVGEGLDREALEAEIGSLFQEGEQLMGELRFQGPPDYGPADTYFSSADVAIDSLRGSLEVALGSGIDFLNAVASGSVPAMKDAAIQVAEDAKAMEAKRNSVKEAVEDLEGASAGLERNQEEVSGIKARLDEIIEQIEEKAALLMGIDESKH